MSVRQDELLAAVRAAPEGPAVLAVFDLSAVLDETPPPRRLLPRRTDPVARVLLDGLRGGMDDGRYSRFLHRACTTLAGRRHEEITAVGRRLFRSRVYGHLYPEAWQLVRAHRARGHTVVLVGEQTRYQLAPVAEELGIEHVLGTTLDTDSDGVLTGQVRGKALWRGDKAEAVRAFARARGLDPARGWVYTGNAGDTALLGLAGHPVPVCPEPAPIDAASFRRRRNPRPVDYARTVAGFAALLGGASAGVLVKAPTRRRRAMADGLMALGTRATLATLGVRVRVSGAHNARSPRPAVFLFNHQSQFDVIIVPYVLGGGVTGIGKKELTRNPVFGPLMRFVGVTFIDRSSTERARAALAPVVDTLRSGLSIAVAPEGTRSYSPEVGPFKKGAFHIALQAGVPVIPVVIRNAGDIAWRNSMIARSGTVDVAILDPIDVRGWDPADLDERVEQVRLLFLRTLLDWPEPDR
ncbi:MULTISPECIES: 1-acylglycerol-3-phosphate O-acyltransferase [Nocardia]|uniref:1-acylglycerol-3-phosphate O-acyltransferase n=2 Tax=Nocardiaceae TaxID=85025 RepID=UPI000BF0263D|nr:MULTISPECIES: 1-acylglycerol-3-phosphate O-acyltransferase [Nocardia]MBF6187121.1 1-acylglycerol-3-phosphate O-acyltransferase [Nocardia farcinica]MBF6312769.1 1-acylglycerol-3-phosphate O-acyltransferase [Nocardia farcinica]MBF6408376.1 1-acylglycerol-3-phosphate O-acyltransferase [Nocardia farcinica]PEH78846.1 HAD-IB family hydrolase [Nocardia sp. FDAARGOS_372]UEX23465.1 1-acylglycerol-3-phosphate O-acyltransferase [Nocardia farcinica]